MNVISFCKKNDFSEYIDFEKFKSMGKEISDSSKRFSNFQVILSDDRKTINSMRAKYDSEALMLIPAVALLKEESPYSEIHKCISSGATALLIKM